MQAMKLKAHEVALIWGSESWLLSAREDAESRVETGPFAGMGLRELYARQRQLFGTKCAGREFPLLVKFIDARDDLSIQVHPRDEDRHVLEPGEAGKTECWYILEATPGAKLYLGFREEITQAQFAQAIADNTLMAHVQAFDVRAGEFFYIPAGTLHAIGRGVLLAEVQQNSDTTYRVYDYNRLQNGVPRPLHVEQAMAVTDLAPYSRAQPRGEVLVRNELFTVSRLGGPSGFSGEVNDDSFVSLVFIEGAGELTCGGDTIAVHKDDSVFIPAGAGEFQVTGNCIALMTKL